MVMFALALVLLTVSRLFVSLGKFEARVIPAGERFYAHRRLHLSVPCCSRVRTIVNITHMTNLTIEKEHSDTFLVHTLNLYVADVDSSLGTKMDQVIHYSPLCKQLASAVGHQIAGGSKYPKFPNSSLGRWAKNELRCSYPSYRDECIVFKLNTSCQYWF